MRASSRNMATNFLFLVSAGSTLLVVPKGGSFVIGDGNVSVNGDGNTVDQPFSLWVLKHVTVHDGCLTAEHAGVVLKDLQSCVARDFHVAIEHSTFQLEPPGHARHEHATHS